MSLPHWLLNFSVISTSPPFMVGVADVDQRIDDHKILGQGTLNCEANRDSSLPHWSVGIVSNSLIVQYQHVGGVTHDLRPF